MIQFSRWQKFRMLVHNLTHRHVDIARKDGSVEMQFCYRRPIARTASLVIDFPQDNLPTVVIDRVHVGQLDQIFKIQTALELRRTAVEMGGRGVTR